ncbi:MAG: DNA mismatch repair endonuclease MutL [Bacillota bacterium]
MGKIKVLDPQTANKIAAGEIVERPVSVVKELIENSIDSNATLIEVEILEGGLTLIRVSDNGWGMDPEDAEKAFQRHATSKISSLNDLFEITTFGFRGEALPSIAAVSQTTIATREPQLESGIKLKIIGGQIEYREYIGMTKGTTIEVRKLFFNTPARRKFIKNPSYEAGLITELITKYSLGHPHVRFKLINNNTTVYDTAGLTTIAQRIEYVYRNDATRNLIQIENQEISSGFYFSAYLLNPNYHRNTKNQQTFFINGRLIKSIELSKVLEEAFHTLLPKGRHPIGILHLQIPSYEIDINIHPAKLEVKINNMENITQAMIKIIQKQLWNSNLHAKNEPEKKEYIRSVLMVKEDTSNIKYQQDVLDLKEEKKNNTNYFNNKNVIVAKEEPINTPQIRYTPSGKKIELNIKFNFIPIGQLNNSFILAQDDKGLYIIDQHTCHERILYEKFLELEEKKEVFSENLLIPLTITLSGNQEGILFKNILLFNSLGFIIESFGPRTILLRGLPVGLNLQNPENFFLDLLDELSNAGSISSTKIKESIIISAACKGAIKANQKISREEMEYLIDGLNKIANPLACPHGRPIIHHLSMQELYRIFQRGEFKGV